MKRGMVFILTLVLVVAMAVTTADAQGVHIPDDNLAHRIRRTLGLGEGAPITAAAMRELTSFFARGHDIADLTGLQHATQLTTLSLGGTGVSDISVLANLTKLEELNLASTGVSDISALANLTKLKTLYLYGTDVSDISVLANLTQLEELDLDTTDVSDISALVNLPQLKTLDLRNCPLSRASHTHVLALRARGVTVNAPDPPPPPVQEPVWEFQRSFHPHADSYSGSIGDIGFRGNSQVFFGKFKRIYKWDMSARRYWWITYSGGDATDRVDHVEVSESHDIFAYNYGDNLRLRRTSDMSLIDSVDLPGDVPDTLSMGPRTNYVIVGGEAAAHAKYSRIYDLWENNSWGLNRSTHEDEQSNLFRVDILNYDYAYGVTYEATFVTELRFRNFQFRTGRHFYPEPRLNYRNEYFAAVAAGQTLIEFDEIVRIAGITNRHNLHVWDWYGKHLYSSNVGFSQIRPRSFQFTPNGKMLTWIKGTGEIVFWDVAYENTYVVVKAEVGDVFKCHAFSEDGKTMAVGMLGGSVRLYMWSGANAPAAPAQETEPVQPTALLANYPNPFNPETWIPYQLSDPAEVTVSIYSVDGRLVRTLELGQMPSGVYSDKERAAYWDGRNAAGEPVASGVYFYTLRAGDFSATRKMVIRK